MMTPEAQFMRDTLLACDVKEDSSRWELMWTAFPITMHQHLVLLLLEQLNIPEERRTAILKENAERHVAPFELIDILKDRVPNFLDFVPAAWHNAATQIHQSNRKQPPRLKPPAALLKRAP